MPITEELLAEVDVAIDADITEEASKRGNAPSGIIVDTAFGDSESDTKEKEDDERKEDARSDSDSSDAGSDDKPGDSEGDSENAEGEEKSGGEDTLKEKDTSPGEMEAISDACLTRAVQAGLSLEEARSFPSSAVLDRAVDSMQAALEAQRQPEQVKQKEPEDSFAGIEKLDPEKFDPEVIEMHESLVGIMRKQHEELQELRSQTAEQTQYSAQASEEAVVREMTEWFDGKVVGLGEDFQEALGEGGMNSLDKYSPQFATREAIANKVAVFLGGYNAAGMQAPDRDEMFDDAARLVLKDTYRQVRERKLSSDLVKRSSQHIQRAGGGKSKSHQSPEESAAEMLDAKFFARK